MIPLLCGSDRPRGVAYIEDVFGINLRTGNGSSATVTGMPNLSTYGGVAHVKNRGAANSHQILSSSRSAFCAALLTDSTAADSGFAAGTFTPTTDGIILANNGANFNASSNTYIDYIWRNAPNFFQDLQVTKSSGSNRTVDLSPYFPTASIGMVKVKRTDSTGSWYVWQRSLEQENLLTYSEQLDNAAYTKTRSSVSANATTAPDGTLTADKLIEDSTASNTHYAEQTSSVTSGGSYAYSVYAKAAERTRINVSCYVGTTIASTFDLSTGSVVSGSGTITAIGNGWYRCSITATASITGTGFFSTYLNNGSGTNYTGDGTSGFYIWGQQLNNYAIVRNYSSTTSSAKSGKLLIGETTAAEATLGHIIVSDKTLTLVNGIIADGDYHVEVYGHDTSAEGLIQCGSFITDGSGNADVVVGWEPQMVIAKATSTTSSWIELDVMRGYSHGTNSTYLLLNSSNAEGSPDDFGHPTTTGFTVKGYTGATQTWVYAVVRRGPMRKPTSGTQVYNAIARTGTGAITTFDAGLNYDTAIIASRSKASATGFYFNDILRGNDKTLTSTTTAAEDTGGLYSVSKKGMTGYVIGASNVNTTSELYIDWFLRRYPGVYQQICHTGDGAARSLPHPLEAIPELVISKTRSTGTWTVYYNFTASGMSRLNLAQTSAATTATYASFGAGCPNAKPTATAFSIASGTGDFNTSGVNYVTYLFATLAGISKVGSYTGTGTTQQIDCGFAAGARFVMIKRTDSTGDWYVWDSVRGIVSGNDPYLLLNSTAAEVTGTDYIDPYNAGFELSSTAPAALNANGGTYIYLAIA